MSDSKAATMPTRAVTKPLRECGTLAEAFDNSEFMQRIRQSVPKHISPDRMLRTFVSAVGKTPLLLQCDMRSVIGAMLTCSQVGLEPNTPLQHAHLIPFKTRRKNRRTGQWEDAHEVQLIFGYPGLLDLSYRSKLLVSVHCDVVWKRDTFEFEYGSNQHLKHIPRGGVHAPEAEPDWAYAHVKLENGEGFEVMPWSDVMSIRDRSQGYRAALSARNTAESEGRKLPATWTEAPWVRNMLPMARKTAFRSLSKWLPKSVEMATALTIDEAQDRQTLDFGAVLEAPVIDGKADYLSAAAETVEAGDPAAAFGVREHAQEETVRTPPRQSAPEQSTPPARRDPAPAPAPAPASAFEAYLADEFGEMVMDGDQAAYYRDPVVFARSLVNRAASNSNPSTFCENNADAIEDARKASAEARQILDDGLAAILPKATPRQPQDAAHESALAVTMPMTGGKPDLKAYLAAIEASLTRHVQTPEDINAWETANREQVGKLPPVSRKAVTALYRARLAAVMPAQQTPEPMSGDADAEWTAATISSLYDLTTTEEVHTLGRATIVQTRMARFKAERPELFKRLDDAFAERLRDLGAPT